MRSTADLCGGNGARRVRGKEASKTLFGECFERGNMSSEQSGERKEVFPLLFAVTRNETKVFTPMTRDISRGRRHFTGKRWME